MTSNKSCGVAVPIDRNFATSGTDAAIIVATPLQPVGLKALASRVLQRNLDRNPPATSPKSDRNFAAKNITEPSRKSCDVASPIGRNYATSEKGEAVGLIRQTESPTPCRDCHRLEVVEIQGKEVHGCLYETPGADYPHGWKRLPEDMKKCIIH